jgi:tetrahydromethanopterin S-methyltransferase subunit G
VARRREIEDREAVIFYIQKKYAEQLRKVAMQRGMTLSGFMRTYVVQLLSQLSGSDPPADPPKPNPNRVLALEELKEFESSLDRLEEKVIQLEEKVRWQREGLNTRVEYEELERLRKEWHAKKRWLYSFSHFLDPQDVMPAVQRLIELKERMENAYKESQRLEEERWSRRREGGQGGYIIIRR